VDEASARRFLDELARDPACLRQLWHFAEERFSPPYQFRRDEEVLDRVARSLVGALGTRLVRRLRVPRFVHYVPPCVEEPRRAQPASVAAWLEIVLLDEDGMPVPDVHYRVVRKDGSKVASGTLNAEGSARVDDLRSGVQYEIVFETIDKDLWTRER
jgi:hypothetical protein